MIQKNQMDEIIQGFPKDLLYIKNYFKSLQRHMFTGTNDSKIKTAYKHILLCQYIHDELMKVMDKLKVNE